MSWKEEVLQMKMMKYKVIREYPDGSRAKRSRVMYRYMGEDPLQIGGLYVHLGNGYPGMQRILSAEEVGEEDETGNCN